MMKDNESPIVGSWVRYAAEGEWGPSVEMYDFRSDNSYRIVVCMLPVLPQDREDHAPQDHYVLPRKDAHQTLVTGISMNGKFELREDTILFKASDGKEQPRRFEINDDTLFLLLGDDNTLLLRRVENFVVEHEAP